MSRRRGRFMDNGAELATQALAVGQNARQMVLNRDPRFTDLAALITQLAGDFRTLTENLAANDLADRALADSVGQLEENVGLATARLVAADEDLAARITAAETAIEDEADTRAAADASEALTRAQADAAEAKARADADQANQAKQDAALAAEQAARQAADAKEAADRQAADTALAIRAQALENYMPAVTSGRASRTNLLLALGATVDIPVVYDTPAPDTTYVPVPVLDAPILSAFTIAGFKNKTTTGITVTVKANVAIALAVTLNVTVLALKL